MDFLNDASKNKDVLSADDILKRYGEANQHMMLWLNVLQTAYDYVIPNRSKFSHKNMQPGQPQTDQVYDWSAPANASSYASNIIANLMPSGTNWAHLKVGRKYKNQKEDAKGMEGLLKHMEDTVFSAINNSNFYQAAHQSLIEMSISCGVLLVHETGNKDRPVNFTSVPLHECVFEGGPGQSIQNVYRKFELPGSVVMQTWKKGKYSANTIKEFTDKPSEAHDIIEATIFYPDMPAHKQWCYIVMHAEKKEIYVKEFRSYNPFICFRPMVYSGELLGRGVFLNMLPAIRTLNRIAEDELRLNSYLSKPIFLTPQGSGTVNPFMAKLVPGSVIPYQTDVGSNRPPMEQLTISGNLQYNNLNSERIKQELVRALGINPIQPGDDPNQTLGRDQLLTAEWKKQNQELLGRISGELNRKVIETVFHICHRAGHWKMPIIDGEHIDIEFDNEVGKVQRQQEVQNVVTYAETLQQTVGPQEALTAFAYGVDVTEFPTWLADMLTLDPKIKRSGMSKSNMLQSAAQQMQQQQQQQGAPQPQAPQQPPGGMNGLLSQQPQIGQGAPAGA